MGTPVTEIAGMFAAQIRIVVVASYEPKIIATHQILTVCFCRNEADSKIAYLHDRIATGQWQHVEFPVNITDECPWAGKSREHTIPCCPATRKTGGVTIAKSWCRLDH